MSARNHEQANVGTIEAPESDRELVASRLFDAPRDLVFRAWSEPARIGRWWGPRGFTTTTAAMDFRPGGVWRFCMHGPDGVDYQNKITYTEIVESERIAYRHGGDEEGDVVDFRVTVTFKDEGGKTRITMRMVFASAEIRDSLIKTHGADKGLEENLDRLGEYAASADGAKRHTLSVTLPSDREIVLTCSFDAPRRLVFEAITGSEHLVHWFGCGIGTLTVVENDFRPGGAWRFVMNLPDGQKCPLKGVYQEIVAPERVVRTYIYDVDFIRDHPSVETLTLDEQDGQTTLRVTVVHDLKESRDGHLQSGMEGGVSQSYDKLEMHITTMNP